MSEQRTASSVACPSADTLATPRRCDVSLAPVWDRLKTSSKLLEAVKWMFSFPAMLGTVLVARVFYETRIFFVDPDVWWHIRVGQDILRTHHWPTTDSFSYTAANTPWIAYEWLGEVILASVAKLGGIVPLFVLLVLAASSVALALYYYGTIRTGNCKAGFVPIAVMGTLTILSFSLRPQMFGYLF